MSDENNDNEFSVENFLKKVQEGDNTLLIVGAILVLLPALFLFFLVGGKSDKKVTHQRLRSMSQRKNVFNFATKNDDGKRAAPSSNLLSSNSTWFGTRTPEQQVRDELHSAFKAVERSMENVEAPYDMEPEEKMSYEAEHNYNYCMALGAIQHGNYQEAENFLAKALDDAKRKGNSFLTAYSYSALCSIYESTGDKKKLEEAIKAYIDSVDKLPNGYSGDLKRSVRDMYQCLMSLSKYSDPRKLSEVISNSPDYQMQNLPTDVNIKDVYKNFPVKYD